MRWRGAYYYQSWIVCIPVNTEIYSMRACTPTICIYYIRIHKQLRELRDMLASCIVVAVCRFMYHYSPCQSPSDSAQGGKADSQDLYERARMRTNENFVGKIFQSKIVALWMPCADAAQEHDVVIRARFALSACVNVHSDNEWIAKLFITSSTGETRQWRRVADQRKWQRNAFGNFDGARRAQFIWMVPHTRDRIVYSAIFDIPARLKRDSVLKHSNIHIQFAYA